MLSTWVIIGVAMLFVAYSMVHFLHDWREGTRHAAVPHDDGERPEPASAVRDPLTQQRIRRNFHHGAD